MKIIKRGDIFYANLNPVVGCEQNGVRPVLIIQNDKGNENSLTTIVAPISTKKFKLLPTHILIKHFNKITKDSIVLLEQIRTIDKSRIGNYIGSLDNNQMLEIDKAIYISLDLKKSSV